MATTNGRYAAYHRHAEVYVRNLLSSGSDQDAPRLNILASPSRRVLSFSTLQPNLLAVSHGAKVSVVDVARNAQQALLEGNGRTVTAISWSATQPDVLVSGTIDGHILFWDLKSSSPLVPDAQVRLHGVCSAIECRPTDAAQLAAVFDGRAVILRRAGPTSPKVSGVIQHDHDSIVSVAWHPSNPEHLLTGSESGTIDAWNISNFAQGSASSPHAPRSDTSDSEDGCFGDLDDLRATAPKLLHLSLEGPISRLKWLSDNTFACTHNHSKHCSMFSWDPSLQQTEKMWSTTVGQPALDFTMTGTDGGSAVVFVSPEEGSKIHMPHPVSEAAGAALLKDEITPRDLVSVSQPQEEQIPARRSMTLISISTLRAWRSEFGRISKQLRHRKPSFERKRNESSIQPLSDTARTRPSSLPPPASMTSSLELPKARDDDSPMPFLSPSIPSRKPSPGEFAALDDNAQLPPLPRASFDSAAPSSSSVHQESDDSDDETFVDGMQESATFLPGGINVPLPKACAALFTPTGELLTFFPPKPKIAPGKGEVLEEEESDPKANAKKIACLFPSFGNLAGEPDLSDSDGDSGFESTSSVSVHNNSLRMRPSFSIFPSSFPSQQSWKSRISPTKHSFTASSPHKVIVSLHEMHALMPSSRALATKYRILCEDEESHAALCRHNAGVSESLGLEDISGIWRLVALLLEGCLPLEVVSGNETCSEVLDLPRLSTDLERYKAGNRRLGGLNGSRFDGPNWANNPFGRTWMVTAVFNWAERRADTQFMALLSAILAQAQEGGSTHRPSYRQAKQPHTSTHQQDYFTSRSGQPRNLSSRPTPILRSTSGAARSPLHESPTKPNDTSTTSSRMTSQPSTPYLESGLSTPPLSLPALGRQSTRLSASGSASPEYHRSSFSAAAKYYAQSISDKFASYGAYGTSPPVRKTGTSPSATNELSSSFQSGSWGKSVSFASTANTTKASLLSTSYGKPQEDEGYDSDKTVEDLSQPQTPKDANECLMTFKNERLFDDDAFGGDQVSFLSKDLIPDCRLWCEYYAEQLRCWDLLSQAAELERACGTTCLRKPGDEVSGPGNLGGLFPEPVHRASNTCSVCCVTITGAQFFCSRCLHSAHLGCLEDLIHVYASEGESDFLCPTGCGCQCDQVPFEVVTAKSEVVPEEKPKKKASFTDPRRWRARVEGDSW